MSRHSQGTVKAQPGHCQGTARALSRHSHSTSFHTVPHCSGTGQVFQVFHSVPPLWSTWNTSQFYRCSLVILGSARSFWYGSKAFLYCIGAGVSKASLYVLTALLNLFDNFATSSKFLLALSTNFWIFPPLLPLSLCPGSAYSQYVL